jgi:UDP-glucose-4-epimerase GalE
MPRLLVTGGAGYVGSHCVKVLAQAGHECIVYDNLSRGHREFAKWGPLVEGDVRDAAKLAETFKRHRIDAVLHFAGLAYVGESVHEPGKYYDVNVHGTRTLLTAMKDARVGKLVFSSTCSVYGVPAVVPIGEETPCNPVNPYGFGKFTCERMMDDFGRAYGLRSVRLRYFNAAGADPDGELGEDHEPETHLIPLVLGAALGKRPPVQVFGTDYPTRDGTAVRDYVHVTDLGDAHARAVKHLLDGGETLVANLGTGMGNSVREVIEGAARIVGTPIPFDNAPRREGDPPELVSAPGRAQSVLGWAPKLSDLDSILTTAWNWHKRQP